MNVGDPREALEVSGLISQVHIEAIRAAVAEGSNGVPGGGGGWGSGGLWGKACEVIYKHIEINISHTHLHTPGHWRGETRIFLALDPLFRFEFVLTIINFISCISH